MYRKNIQGKFEMEFMIITAILPEDRTYNMLIGFAVSKLKFPGAY